MFSLNRRLTPRRLPLHRVEFIEHEFVEWRQPDDFISFFFKFSFTSNSNKCANFTIAGGEFWWLIFLFISLSSDLISFFYDYYYVMFLLYSYNIVIHSYRQHKSDIFIWNFMYDRKKNSNKFTLHYKSVALQINLTVFCHIMSNKILFIIDDRIFLTSSFSFHWYFFFISFSFFLVRFHEHE